MRPTDRLGALIISTSRGESIEAELRGTGIYMTSSKAMEVGLVFKKRFNLPVNGYNLAG